MDDIPKSHFQPTVCLNDWWLFKSEENELQGSRLGVAGVSSGGKQQPKRIFSGPILKRHDVFTLETTDGRCVILQGLINKVRTVENGFSSDVCKHFVCGFPLYWREYIEKFMHEESRSDISMDTCDKDLGSKEKKDVKGKSRSKKSKPSAVPLTQFDNGTPGEREKGSTASPQSSSFSRSRSGRLLMPTMEFWRNQIPIYDLDGTVTGVEEDSDLEQPTKKGSGSRRKRRQLI